jgi:hypothetical protein
MYRQNAFNAVTTNVIFSSRLLFEKFFVIYSRNMDPDGTIDGFHQDSPSGGVCTYDHLHRLAATSQSTLLHQTIETPAIPFTLLQI